MKSLLASVSLAFPIGAVMMLETGNADVRFKPRPIEGVSLPSGKEPEQLILDGQQRLTSLYLSLMSKEPVDTRDSRKKAIKRWYYVDIEKALDPMADREEAIVSLPEDRKLRNFRGDVTLDNSKVELECENELLPLNIVLDLNDIFQWQRKYLEAGSAGYEERINRWTQIHSVIIQPFQQYQLPVITLRKETPKEAVCQVFEKVNTGGVTLTVFELLTATFAADDYSLRDDWAARKKQLNANPVLRGVDSDDVLQVVALLTSRARRRQAIEQGIPQDRLPGITCKRKDILRLSLTDYKTWIDHAIAGFVRAGRMMHSQHIFADRDLPYRSQLTPLAAILTTLGENADHDGTRSQILQWYWCGVFGELYGGATETRFARDLPDVVNWVEDASAPIPTTITDANFSPQRLLSLRTRNSAAYKGIHSILMRGGGEDFRTGEPIEIQTYFDDRIDIHHIFPQKWCRANGIDQNLCNSVVNKTAISARTNRIISGKAPSAYLADLERIANISSDRMDSILTSHVIEPLALRCDDFEEFFNLRKNALVNRIEDVMGKKAHSPLEEEGVEAFFDDDEDEQEEAVA